MATIQHQVMQHRRTAQPYSTVIQQYHRVTIVVLRSLFEVNEGAQCGLDIPHMLNGSRIFGSGGMTPPSIASACNQARQLDVSVSVGDGTVDNFTLPASPQAEDIRNTQHSIPLPIHSVIVGGN